MTTVRAIPVQRWTRFTGSNVQEIKDAVFAGSGITESRWSWNLVNETLTVDTQDFAGEIVIHSGDWVNGAIMGVQSDADFRANYYLPDGDGS